LSKVNRHSPERTEIPLQMLVAVMEYGADHLKSP
jgi:hypothetical protein